MAIVGIGAAANAVGDPAGAGFTASFTQVAGQNRVAMVSTAMLTSEAITAIDFGGSAMTLMREHTVGTLIIQKWGVLEVNLPANGTFDITATGTSGGR